MTRIAPTRSWLAALLVLVAPLVSATTPASAAEPSPDALVAGASFSRQDVARLTAFVNGHGDDFAGSYYEPGTGRYVVAVPEGRSLQATAQQLSSTYGGAQPSGTTRTVVVAHQRRSLTQLRHIRDQVTQGFGAFGRAAAGVLAQWGLDEQRNVVRIGVTRLDEGLRQAARSTYGDAVQLVQTDRMQPASRVERVSAVRAAPAEDVPARLLDGRPYWAGDRIGWINGNTITECTNGWIGGIHNPATLVLTAGHCFPQLNARIQQGYCVHPQPDTCEWNFTGDLGLVNLLDWGNNRPDFASINPAGFSTVERNIYRGPVDVFEANAESDELGPGPPGTNEPVCTDGSVTGEQCSGIVTLSDGCVTITDPQSGSVNVCHVTVADSTTGTRIVEHGDSGGPVLANDSLSFLEGIISFGNVGDHPGGGPGTEVGFTNAGAICSLHPVC